MGQVGSRSSPWGQSLLTRSIAAFDITPVAYDQGILVIEACGFRTVPRRECTVLGLDDRLNTAWSVAEPEQPGQPWSTYPAPLPTVAIARTQGGLVRLSADRGQPILTVTAPDLAPITPMIPRSRPLLRTTTPAASAGPTTFTLWKGETFWGYEAGSHQVEELPEHTWIDAVTRLQPVGVDDDDPPYADAIRSSEADADWRFDPPGDRAAALAATPGQRFIGYEVVGWNPLRAHDSGPFLGRLDATTGALTAVVEGQPSTTDTDAEHGFAAFGPTGGVLLIDRDDGEVRYYDAA